MISLRFSHIGEARKYTFSGPPILYGRFRPMSGELLKGTHVLWGLDYGVGPLSSRQGKPKHLRQEACMDFAVM